MKIVYTFAGHRALEPSNGEIYFIAMILRKAGVRPFRIILCPIASEGAIYGNFEKNQWAVPV